MGCNEAPGAPGCEYPNTIVNGRHDKEAASRALVDWVHYAFDTVCGQRSAASGWFATSMPGLQSAGEPVRSAPRQVVEGTDDWRQLASHLGLWTWLFSASRDETISKIYGTSERPFDQSYFALEYEAFDFLNSQLQSRQEFDEAAVRAEVDCLWEDLGSETETYEAGALIYNLVAEPGAEVLRLNTHAELRRVQGEWALQRFESDASLPEGCWAVAVEIKRRRKPLEVWIDPYGIRRREGEEEEINRALLALRLIRPTVYITSLPYRVGIACYHRPPQRARLGCTEFDILRSARREVRLSEKDIEDLTALGAILEQQAKPEGQLPRRQAQRRDVACRAFTAAFERREWQDRVVDLVEVLEALFGEGQEITYKVAMRTSLVLGRNREHSERVFRAVKSLYSLRSAIVHAGTDVQGRARRVVEEWCGGSAVSCGANDCGKAVAKVAFEIAAAALRSLLLLNAESGYRPFEDKFKETIDALAFSEADRRNLQAHAYRTSRADGPTDGGGALCG